MTTSSSSPSSIGPLVESSDNAAAAASRLFSSRARVGDGSGVLDRTNRSDKGGGDLSSNKDALDALVEAEPTLPDSPRLPIPVAAVVEKASGCSAKRPLALALAVRVPLP